MTDKNVCASCREPHTDTEASVKMYSTLQWHENAIQVLTEMVDDLQVPAGELATRVASVLCPACVESVHAVTVRVISEIGNCPWSPALFQWRAMPIVVIEDVPDGT